MKLHQARGWHAVWTGRTTKRTLPGDTDAVVVALHEANDAGLLPPNALAEGWPYGQCPRCGRDTALARWGDLPSVCTGCRASRMSDQARRG